MLNFKQVETQPGYIWKHIASILYTCTTYVSKGLILIFSRHFAKFCESKTTLPKKHPGVWGSCRRDPSWHQRSGLLLVGRTDCDLKITWKRGKNFTVPWTPMKTSPFFFFGPLEIILCWKLEWRQSYQTFFQWWIQTNCTPLNIWQSRNSTGNHQTRNSIANAHQRTRNHTTFTVPKTNIASENRPP